MTDIPETDSPLRRPQGLPAAAIAVWCAGLSLVHLVNAIWPFLSDFNRNALHFIGFAVLAALLYPAGMGAWARSRAMLVIDIGIAAAAAGSAAWFILYRDRLFGDTKPFELPDWIAATLLVVLAAELTRRVAGVVVPILIVLSMTYVTVWGSWITGMFAFPGFRWETALLRSVYNDDGMFGTIAQISSTTVFLFIIFGAFLVRSGAGDFVIELSRAVAGRLVGGPGLMAVLSSALTGTISGSAVANTAATGVITIPLMKKAGYKPAFAGGVEAAASTGGQLMPPIMGAGAFIMASYTRIPYETIVLMATLPAILYFASVAFFVRIEARRLNLAPLSADGETLGSALRKGGAPFILPIGLLIWMLIAGYTPNYAAVFAIAAVIVSSWASAHPMGPRAIFGALVDGAKGMIMTAILLVSVGLVINVIATTGIGNTFSLQISAWAGGNIVVAILLIALASLVLGLGLPVTAAYIVLATLSAPALAGMLADREVIALIAQGTLPEAARGLFLLTDPGALPRLAAPMPLAEAQALVRALPLEIAAPLRDMVISPASALTTLLAAHMIIFWLSQDSNVTPPVALVAFTAAAIAKAPPMRTGVESWKLAKGLYIVPLLFAYSPLLSGDWGLMLLTFGFGIVGLYALAGALQGCLEHPVGPLLRVALLVAGAMCLWPGSILLHVAGAVLVVGLLALNLRGIGTRRPA
ncbi:MAG: TRAP transporter permease [Gemmobacter sp.]